MTTHFPRPRKPHIQATETPCVHCGADENQLFIHGVVRPDGTPVDPLYHVACNQCKASGPVAKSTLEAIKAWAHSAAVRLDETPPVLLGGMEFDDEEPESEVA